MKVTVALSLACICVVLMASHVQAKPAEPTTTQAPRLCDLVCPPARPDDDVILMPLPDDCEAYCQCDGRGAIYMQCPVVNKETQERLHFNPTDLICDWPINAGCKV